MLKVINSMFQINLATRHSKNRCWMFSSNPHRLHLESPFHLIFNKLSFVTITPLFRYQRKNLIFKGNFAFQNSSLFLYIKTTLRTFHFFPICQMNLSLSLFQCTGSTKDTKLSHSFSLSPTNPVLKEIFNGVELSTEAIETSFFLTILNFRISGC